VGESLADDDYELLPHKELELLRAEVERLKRNPLGVGVSQQSLMDALTALNANVAKLTSILQGANDDLLKAYQDTSAQDELRKVRAENAKIAHGIVAVAQLVKDLEQRQGALLPKLDQVLEMRTQAPQQASQDNSVSFHGDALAAELDRGTNPFADIPPPSRGQPRPVPEMDVPPPPPAFR